LVWIVIWSKKSVKQLKKLNKSIARRIRDRVLEITDDPYKATKRLVNNELYSLRMGNYRVIMDLKRGQLIIFVVSTSKRKHAYG